jgi:hypothetical protein
MIRQTSALHPRFQLGLSSALLVLAACATNTIDDDDNGDDDSETQAESESDSGVEPLMCTPENYADDPQVGDFLMVDCVAADADGSCAVCDLPCMEVILPDSECEFCFEAEPADPPEPPLCLDGCGVRTLLCSEPVGDQCCYLVTGRYDGGEPGRPLREAGTPRLPALEASGPQSEAGRRYREFARYERASVDAFAYAAALLDELGAPDELVEAHRVAAREEAEHARLALACAQSLDGCVASLGELDSFAIGDLDQLDIERFVCDLIHDGCIGELIAAREAGWALAQADVREREPLRRYWRAVLTEETGHAQLAWETLEWLLAARPGLEPVVAKELGTAMEPRARVFEAGVGFGLPGGRTRADLGEQTIASLRASARASQAETFSLG